MKGFRNIVTGFGWGLFMIVIINSLFNINDNNEQIINNKKLSEKTVVPENTPEPITELKIISPEYYNPTPTPIVTPKMTPYCDQEIYNGVKRTICFDEENRVVVDKEEKVQAEPTPVAKSTSENFMDFITYVQNNWNYIVDPSGKLVQEPQESYRLLSGDCDDFATMVAYYGQEVYGFDTKIVIVKHWSGNNHAVTFVATSDEGIQNIGVLCRKQLPLLEDNGVKYIAIDWNTCPDWTWSETGNKIQSYEWNDFVGTAR